MRDAEKFRRHTFYYPTICKDNNKIKIVKILIDCYEKMVPVKMKEKVLERRKNLYIFCVTLMVSKWCVGESLNL